MAYSGRFSPKNPKKYEGNPTNIFFRSLWELKFMKWCDDNPNVIQWSSEEIIIPYISPVDNKYHRYFPDIKMKTKDAKGNVKTTIVEIKPLSQTQPPKKKKRVTKKYINEVMTYSVNQAKFLAAAEFCENRGWDFKIITEVELNIK